MKILIIRLSAIGDTIHTLPLAYALREKYPDAQIDWIVEDKAAQFVQNNPLLNNVFVVPKKEWKKRGLSVKNCFEFSELAKKLKKEKYDISIDTQQLLKSAVWLKVSGAKRRIALSGGREFSRIFANEIIPAKYSLHEKNYHVVKRNLEIAKYLEADSENINFVLPTPSCSIKEKVDELLSGLDKNKKTLIISPATTWATKHWTVEGWKKIIEEFKNRVNLVITGTPADTSLITEILEDNDSSVLNLCGKTKLNELAELFRRADVVVAPDSGSAQIAWAVGKPFVFSIFTATSNARTAPFGKNATSVCPKISCYPCHKKRCKFKDANFEQCKNNIDYCEIIKKLNEAL